ncbi:hypothetical protein JCM1841_003906 [Sporobolomyces salmonicolor]
MISFKRRSRAALDRPEEDEIVKGRPPLFLRVRSSTWWIALCVGFGILVDLSSYSIAVPVIPFRLEQLGYTDIGSKTGWLVAAYSGGLIASSPPAAYIGGKYKGRQIPLVLGLLFMAAAIVIFMEAKSFALMVVARILQGFSGTVLWTIGLALLTDSVSEERAGVVIGYAMIGFSVGQAIGPPVGGTLYARYGYRAPFIFSLVLVGVDLAMRLILIEKHQALAWIRAGVGIPNFEAPGYVDPMSLPDPTAEPDNTISGKPAPIPLAGNARLDEEAVGEAPETAVKEEESKVPSHWRGLWYMIKDPRALTSFALTFLNGFILGGLLDTSMTLHLNNAYGLSSFGAGLVFIGAVAPTFIGSPLSGWVVDKYGTKWIMFVGVALSVPAYPLLIIHGPLALFIFFLVIVGLAISFFLTPVTVDLNLVAADTPGLTTPHVFGAFNLAFSIGSFIGPIIAGQVIAAVEIARAWVILAILSAALSVATLPFIFLYIGGGRPRWGKLRGVGRREEIAARNGTRATQGERLEGGE